MYRVIYGRKQHDPTGNNPDNSKHHRCHHLAQSQTGLDKLYSYRNAYSSDCIHGDVEMSTCKTCKYNDDLLCDLYGKLVEDDDEACRKYSDSPDTSEDDDES